MGQEGKKSAERIKQEIEFYKENLKFLNSFYLPISTGVTLIFFSNDSNPNRAGWLVAGLFSLAALSMLRRGVLKNIRKLIKEL